VSDGGLLVEVDVAERKAQQAYALHWKQLAGLELKEAEESALRQKVLQGLEEAPRKASEALQEYSKEHMRALGFKP